MRIYLKVSPKSAKNEIKFISEGTYQIKTTAIAQGGKANIAVVEILSKHFKVAKSLIKIVGGKSAKNKIVDIQKDV
jgi:uncharacterized protein (TIGR00251 family)